VAPPHSVAPGRARRQPDLVAALIVGQVGQGHRFELTLAEGEPIWAQLTRAQAEELELAEKQIVYTRPSRKKVFDADCPRTEELVAA